MIITHQIEPMGQCALSMEIVIPAAATNKNVPLQKIAKPHVSIHVPCIKIALPRSIVNLGVALPLNESVYKFAMRKIMIPQTRVLGSCG